MNLTNITRIILCMKTNETRYWELWKKFFAKFDALAVKFGHTQQSVVHVQTVYNSTSVSLMVSKYIPGP